MRSLKLLLNILFIFFIISYQYFDIIQFDDTVSKESLSEKIKRNDEKTLINNHQNRNMGTMYKKEEKSIATDTSERESVLNTKEKLKENRLNFAKSIPKKNKQSTSKKSKDKPNDKVAYGDIEYVDEVIPYKKLEDKQDSNRDKGTSGVLTQGQDGLQRKEVRKVYVNGKYSHTETIKQTYTVKEPVHAQDWVGTKEVTQKPDDIMIIDNETWYLYKTFSTDTLCIQNINALQEQNFREWDGGSMCWGEHLYYSTGN